MEPEQLIRACAAGDGEAWKSFVTKWGPWMLHAAKRALPGRESEAEDVVSDVFRQLLENKRALLRSFRPPYNVASWLAIIVRRSAGKVIRKRRPQPGLEADPAGKPRVISPLNELLSALPSDDRLLVKLFYEDGASYEEISRITGIAVDSVGKRKFRAIQALKEIARKKGIEFPPGSGPGTA